MKRRALLTAAGAAITTASAGCLGAFTTTVEESFENTYDVSGETTVVVSNRNGSVTVRDTDDDQLTVTGEKRASSQDGLDSVTVDVTQGEQFAVEGTFSSGSNFESRSLDLTVDVPKGVTVERAQTENGNVSVSDVRGDVRATTQNGNVTVTGVDGFVRCETSSGNVRSRNTTGLDSARTSNGLVDVELLAMDGDVTCRSSNGSVTVRVGSDVAAAFELQTSNGTASVEDLDYTSSTSTRTRIEGQLRGGSEPTLTLSSSNGNVTLRPAED